MLAWITANVRRILIGLVGLVILGVAIGAACTSGFGAIGDDNGNGQTASVNGDKCGNGYLVSNNCQPPAKTADANGKCPGDRELHAGETFQVPAGCNVKGDIVVNGVKQFDDDPTTGLLVSCPAGCTIKAPFGANVSPRTVDDLKAEMLASGCGSKCASVKVVVIDGGATKPQVTVTDRCDVSLPKGTKAIVPGGCVVSGDVAVNGKALYDSDQTTGLVVIVKSDVEVFAPFGASVTNADPQDVVNAVKQTGCGLPNGCRIVIVVTVP